MTAATSDAVLPGRGSASGARTARVSARPGRGRPGVGSELAGRAALRDAIPSEERSDDGRHAAPTPVRYPEERWWGFTACPCRGEVQPPDGCRGRLRHRGGLHERPVDRTTCRNCFLDRAPGTRVCPGEGPSHSGTQVVKSRRCWSASRGCRRRASLPNPGATHQGSCMRVSSPSSSARRSWCRHCRPPTR